MRGTQGPGSRLRCLKRSAEGSSLSSPIEEGRQKQIRSSHEPSGSWVLMRPPRIESVSTNLKLLVCLVKTGVKPCFAWAGSGKGAGCSDIYAESQVELVGGLVVHPKVRQDCAACFEFLQAKWCVFSCVAKCSRAGFVIYKLLTCQPCL